MTNPIASGNIIEAAMFANPVIPRASMTSINTNSFSTNDESIVNGGYLKKGGAIYVTSSSSARQAAFITNVSTVGGVATVSTTGWSLASTTGNFSIVPTSNIMHVGFYASDRFMENSISRNDILSSYVKAPYLWRMTSSKLVFLEMKVDMAASTGSDRGVLTIGGSACSSTSYITLNESWANMSIIDTPSIEYGDAIDIFVENLSSVVSDASSLSVSVVFVVL